MVVEQLRCSFPRKKIFRQCTTVVWLGMFLFAYMRCPSICVHALMKPNFMALMLIYLRGICICIRVILYAKSISN